MATKAQARPAKREPKRPTVKKRVNAVPKIDEKPLRNLERITDRLRADREKAQATFNEQIDAIFEARNAGFSLRKIAESADVSNPRIHAILREFAEA
jgi:hypothetical protein